MRTCGTDAPTDGGSVRVVRRLRSSCPAPTRAVRAYEVNRTAKETAQAGQCRALRLRGVSSRPFRALSCENGGIYAQQGPSTPIALRPASRTPSVRRAASPLPRTVTRLG